MRKYATVRELNSLPATHVAAASLNAFSGFSEPDDPLTEEYDVTLARENDARELAIYGELLMDMRILRQRGFGVWLDAECSEVADEFGCERMFNVGTAPRFASEMHDMAERFRAELIDGVEAANDNG